MPAIDIVLTDERRRRRQDAPLPVADVQVLSVHRRPCLAHLRIQHHADRRRLRRIASATPRSRMIGPTTSPRQPRSSIAPAVAAPQPNGGGIDRFLSERAESLALEAERLELHVAAGEQLLEPIVDGTRQHHAAEDLAPFFRRERRGDGCPRQKAVHVLEQFLAGGLQARLCRHAGRRLRDLCGREPRHPLAQARGETAARTVRWLPARRSVSGAATSSSARSTSGSAKGCRSRTKARRRGRRLRTMGLS